MNPTPVVRWSYLQKCTKYMPGQKTCDLCLSEKLFILKAFKDKSNINVRNEVASICRHRNDYKLSRTLSA